MSGISGYTMVRNARELDYPVDLTIRSLLVGCDEVVVGVAESTDGTLEWLRDLFSGEPRVVIVPQPWSDPVADPGWWVRWINETRSHLSYDVQFMLDADEVSDPTVWTTLRAEPAGSVVTLKRLNYWRNRRTIVRTGHCCSDKVVRFAPAALHMTSDEIYDGVHFPADMPEIRKRARERLNLRIHHLGFLRKRDALFRKVEVCLRAWWGSSQDTRLVEAAKSPDRHWSEFIDQPVEPFNGPWPELIVPWLRERNAL